MIFFEQTFSFKVSRYKTDILHVEVLSGEYQGVVLELDLGTNSNIPSLIKAIRSEDGKEIFHQTQVIDSYLSEAESAPVAIDISALVEQRRVYYKTKLKEVLEFLGKAEVERIANQLLTERIFTIQEVEELIS